MLNLRAMSSNYLDVPGNIIGKPGYHSTALFNPRTACLVLLCEYGRYLLQCSLGGTSSKYIFPVLMPFHVAMRGLCYRSGHELVISCIQWDESW
jgi:hypothetical protein